MNDVRELFTRWQLDLPRVREQVYRAPTPRERERWHALWLLARGWSQAQVAEALDRDAHTVGEWVERFRQSGPTGLVFEQTGGPPALAPAAQATLKAAVQRPQGTRGSKLPTGTGKLSTRSSRNASGSSLGEAVV